MAQRQNAPLMWGGRLFLFWVSGPLPVAPAAGFLGAFARPQQQQPAHMRRVVTHHHSQSVADPPLFPPPLPFFGHLIKNRGFALLQPRPLRTTTRHQGRFYSSEAHSTYAHVVARGSPKTRRTSSHRIRFLFRRRFTTQTHTHTAATLADTRAALNTRQQQQQQQPTYTLLAYTQPREMGGPCVPNTSPRPRGPPARLFLVTHFLDRLHRSATRDESLN